MAENRKIVVTGATGFIGRVLSERLSAGGDRLVVLSRSPERARASLPFPHESVGWDPERGPAPAEALRGADAVIHLAGESVAARRWSDEQKRRIYDSRVVGTRNLVRTLNDLGSEAPRQFLAASAIGIYGNRGDEVLPESASRGPGFLADVVADWEAAAREARDARLVLVRIGMVLGHGGALEKMLPAFRAGVGGPIGDGKQWIPWIHVEDLASLFVTALEHGEWNGVFNGVGPQPVTNEEFSRTLAHVLHRPCLFRAPAFALRLAMGEMAELVLSSQRVVPERAEKEGFPFRFRTLEAALADLLAKGGD